ncbi:hypothetical protein [Streptomyces sp. NPDC059761]|uniref:hypothetical protein n=1 Tax=Streptomyces sp. NPDC059761 TaxID=3346937 RepID=UPI00365BB5BC
MARKISKTMAAKLVAALADPNHEMTGAATNTERAMIERGLVRHQELHTRITDKRGHLVRSHGLVLTEDGLTEARRLGGVEAPAPIEVQPVMHTRVASGNGIDRTGVPTAAYWVRKEVEGAQAAGHRVTVGAYYGEIKIEGEGQTVRFWPQTDEEQAPAPAAPAAQETPAPAPAAETKPAAAAKRGDLVIVEMNVPYAVGTDRIRTERTTDYDVMVVTGLFRDGRIRMVRSLAWGDNSAPMPLESMLYATGARKIVHADTITDMAGVVAAVRAHTYPNSTTPRRFPSLDAVKNALRPFHAPAADPKITRDDVAEGVRDAIQWLPMGQRPAAEARPASLVLLAEWKRSGAVMRKLLKSRGRVPVTTQAVTYYGRVTALLAAARRFESLDTATAPVSA